MIGTPELAAALAAFRLRGRPAHAAEWPGGRIHASYRVDCHDGSGRCAYLVQRLNTRVFVDPAALMDNVVAVIRHCGAAARAEGSGRSATPTLVPTVEGGWWHRDGEGRCWRAFEFIASASPRERASSPDHAGAAARAFGRFLRLLASYDGPPLHETIPGFHDTAARLSALAEAARRDPCGRAAAARAETDAVLAEGDVAALLPPLLESGAVPTRVVHNDAKLANVLLDERTGEALCVIDLDTVMPGSALYDFGDLARSLASPGDEDETDLTRVAVRPEYFAALVRGYLEEAGAVLTGAERERLVFAARLITLEQAARFLTDHLTGDRYYRLDRPGQNLARARNQLALYRSLTRQADALEAIVAREGARRLTS